MKKFVAHITFWLVALLLVGSFSYPVEAQRQAASNRQPASSRNGLPFEGWGASATGGDGHSVVNVTNLNDSGAGSLRAAIEGATGNRIVKFTTSGTINLSTDIESTGDNITIDGSDAPNQGICVAGNTVILRGDNLIVRYIRFRSDEQGTSSIDSLQLAGATNVIIDHCSVTWGDDGCLDITSSSTDITVQYCIIGESFGVGGMLITNGSTRISVIGNIFSQAGNRNPEHDSGQAQIINNVIYRNEAGAGGASGYAAVTSTNAHFPPIPVQSNIVNNYFDAGSDETVNGNEAVIYVRLASAGSEGQLSPQSYVDGNRIPSGHNHQAEYDEPWMNVGTPFDFPTITTVSASQAFTNATTSTWNVGASLPCRDSVDTRIISDVINREGTVGSDSSGYGGYPDLTQPCPNGSGSTRNPASGRSPASGRVPVGMIVVEATPEDTRMVVGLIGITILAMLGAALLASRRTR